MERKYSFSKDKIKVLVLENINQSGVQRFKQAGFTPEEIPQSLASEALMEIISEFHILCIRSKTKVTAQHIKKAEKLLAIGCFGVGTNQVAVEEAAEHGVPVFNAPL
jgi:D-3-phosphoglycerate dehydrogenase / 2-oxoglutarate reductase